MSIAKKISIFFLWVLILLALAAALGLFAFAILEATGNTSLLAFWDDSPNNENYPFSGPVTQIVWFYKPPENGDLETVAQNFDVFILTHKDEAERDQLRDLGVTAPMLQYLRFDAIMDPGDCNATPWGNQVAYQPGDFCAISTQHPDWFLLDSGGNRIIDGENFVYMDPGNLEWQAYFLQRTAAMQESFGWDGVFLDNVEASLEKHSRAGGTQTYASDAKFQSAVLNFLKYLYNGYFQVNNRPLYANIISLKDPDTWFEYLNALDGAMVEAWAVDWKDGYRWPDRWEEHLQIAEQTQAMGKHAILIAQGEQNNPIRQQFAYASYLLITEGNASFRYSLANNHGKIWLYPNYQYDLGNPLGPRYPEGKTWRRDFENGAVIVDPQQNTSQIILP